MSLTGDFLFRVAVRIPSLKLSVPTKQATLILIKVKSCGALLRMLIVCFRSHVQSVMRYKFLILGTYHADTIFK